MLPVYFINGFLESGKTEFIKYTLDQPYFKTQGTTLLILCEEGELEYEEKFLRNTGTVIEILEEEEEFSTANLLELEKKYRPERIVIEFNGMWNMKEIRLPIHWSIEQQITMIDASTFPMYYTNMKSMVAEMIRKSEMIIFNRCDGIEDLSIYKRNVKAINRRAEIIFEDSQGEIEGNNDMEEEDLPYDLNQSVIELDNDGYGIWYLDSLDHIERYVGKTVRFVGQVLKPRAFPKNYFVPGRLAMTCCADDMAFLGFACEYKKAYLLQERSWVEVTATVKKEYWPDYNGEGPVLYAVKVEKTNAPEDEIINFI